MTDRVVMTMGDTPQDPGQVPEGATDGVNGGVNIPDGPTPPSAPARPDWLPEKFESAEALAQAYSELEKKMGQGSQEPPPAPKIDTPPPAVDVIEAGFDPMELRQEFLTNDGLGPETYAKFEAKGIGKDIVDGWIEGQRAIAAQRTAEVYDAAGGPETFKAMAKWAAEGGITPAEIEAFNQAMDAPDSAAAKLAVRGLRAAFESSEGVEPKLIHGQAGNPQGVAPFRSDQEIVEAMRNPRYKTDAAYRKEVEERLSRSDLIQTYG